MNVDKGEDQFSFYMLICLKEMVYPHLRKLASWLEDSLRFTRHIYVII